MQERKRVDLYEVRVQDMIVAKNSKKKTHSTSKKRPNTNTPLKKNKKLSLRLKKEADEMRERGH